MFTSLMLAAALVVQPVSPPPPLQVAVQNTPQDGAFQRMQIPDEGGPAIEAGVWLPSEAEAAAPLVVISHGTGGDFRSHEATALALAHAGFVVAALTHTGDNWRDRSRAMDMAERPRQLGVLIEYMLSLWEGHERIDAAHVGAFGFSSGGFTVLTAAGGEPDLSRTVEHCRAHPGFYDCRMMASGRPGGAPAAWSHDPRIKALVVAAPALGFTFSREGLERVTQPVQLWRAERDMVLPSPYYVEAVRDALPTTPDYHVAQGAGHFDLMPPCSERLAEAAPQICVSAADFDRAAFHQTFNAQVVRFFREMLKD